MKKQLFKKYYTRAAVENLKRALIYGLIAAFSVLLVGSVTVLITANKAALVTVAILAAAALVVSAAVIFLIFLRPTTISVVKQLDALGLHERLLTMVELEKDTSYIAMKQREDAKAALRTVSPGAIKFVISLPLLLATIAIGLLGVGVTTVTALVDLEKPPQKFELLYGTIGKGALTGDLVFEDEKGETLRLAYQIVEENQDAKPVVAVPERGWAFVTWSDGLKDPYRLDAGVFEGFTVYALFEELDETNEDHPEKDFLPPPPSEGGNGGGQGGGSGGVYVERNMVIDGKTYYGGKTFENAYKDAISELSQDSNIPDRLKDLVSDYFDAIEKSDPNAEGGD